MDSSIPTVNRKVLVLIVFGALAAFSLSVAAEATRVQSYQILETAYHTLECSYPSSPATILASIAVVVLFLTEVVAFRAAGSSWMRPLLQRHLSDNKAVVGRAVQRVIVVLIMNVLFLLAALALLITAAVENKYHVSSVPYGTQFMSCSMVGQGVFLSAAFLTTITCVLTVAYYVYAVRANEEMWLTNYVAAPVVVDMEAFSRETARTSITSINSDKRRPAEDGAAEGKMTSITNTPITNARLA